MDEHEYTGHLHIHSTFSDGSATVPEIAADAAKAGLDFIVITDHNTLEGLDRGLEGRHNGVLVLFGTEINMRKNHYIAFGVRAKVPQNEEDPRRLSMMLTAWGFGYLAHPLRKQSGLYRGAFIPGTSGMSAALQGWRSGILAPYGDLPFGTSCRPFLYFTDPYRGARYPDPQGLALWDSLSRERPLVAFAGSDAHGIKVRFGPFKLKIFPYDFLFRTLNTHILLEEELPAEVGRARKQVFDALRAGRFFIGSDYLGHTRGFRFTAGNDGKDEVSMGQELPFSSTTGLHIVSPSPRGLIRIIKNGRLLHESSLQEIRFKVPEPGFTAWRCTAALLGGFSPDL